MGKPDGKVALITGGARGQRRSHEVSFARGGESGREITGETLTIAAGWKANNAV